MHTTEESPEIASLDNIVPAALFPVNQLFFPLGMKVSEIAGGVESYLKTKFADPELPARSVQVAETDTDDIEGPE